MTTLNFIEIEAVRTKFFSPDDEAAFFEWIAKIPSINKWTGSGDSIYFSIDNDSMNEEDLRELLSLFRRYEISMKQLSVFDRSPFSKWLRNKKAYWFSEVFGD